MQLIIKKNIPKRYSKFIQSNILLGNIILENIKELNAKQFINFSTTWEDLIIKKITQKIYMQHIKKFQLLIQYYKK